ncbi:unnamed protein product [Prorocentrum cordatum]|uniref:Glycerophosphocholine acyltransferase 1 n=1 Tax=Prorocentrum cordatum TaxID=2364126 RepID=A0ABN9X152_9DINO|nr:unnamed protein product [Polarella glacialis]
MFGVSLGLPFSGPERRGGVRLRDIPPSLVGQLGHEGRPVHRGRNYGARLPLGLPLVLLQALLFVAAFAFLPPFVPRVAANSLIAASLCIGVCVAPLPLQMLQYFTTDRSAPEQVVAIVLWLAFFLCLFYPLSQWIFMSLMRGAGTLAGHALRQWRGGRGSVAAYSSGTQPVGQRAEQLPRLQDPEPSSLSREHSRLSRQLL